MEKEKREELKNKQQKLREEFKLKERIPEVISYLKEIQEPFVLYTKFENLNWVNSNVLIRKKDGYNGIHGDFQIDVDDSDAFSEFNIKEDEIDSDVFTEQFSSVIPNVGSLIVCHLGGDPELEISNKAFLSKPTIFFSRPETWVITTDKNWIIEYLWDQGVVRFIDIQNSPPVLIKKIRIEY